MEHTQTKINRAMLGTLTVGTEYEVAKLGTGYRAFETWTGTELAREHWLGNFAAVLLPPVPAYVEEVEEAVYHDHEQRWATLDPYDTAKVFTHSRGLWYFGAAKFNHSDLTIGPPVTGPHAPGRMEARAVAAERAVRDMVVAIDACKAHNERYSVYVPPAPAVSMFSLADKHRQEE